MSLPAFVSTLLKEKRFPELIYFFRKKWDEHAWLALKKNGNAVERIKQEFTRLTQKPPYSSSVNEKYWDQQIAKYADRLGVKFLIYDIRQSVKKYQNIRSIAYFIYSKYGACRWENLLMDKIELDLKQEKKRHTKEMDELAQSLPLSPFFKGDKLEPDWVGQAKKRLEELKHRRFTNMSPHEKYEVNREIRRIITNLNNHGF